MNFFELMNASMIGFDMNIIIAKNHDTPDGMLTISVLPKAIGNSKVVCAPFVMVETPAFLDTHFEELFKAPAKATTDLFEISKQYASVVAKQASETKALSQKGNPATKGNAVPTKALPAVPFIDRTKKIAFDKIMVQAEAQTKLGNWKFAKMYLVEALKQCPDDGVAKAKLGAVELKLNVPIDIFSPAPTVVVVDVENIVKGILNEDPTGMLEASGLLHDDSDIPEDEHDEDEELVEHEEEFDETNA